MKAENIVKEVCAELGINQAELARMLDVSPASISEWNKGKIPKMAQMALELMIKEKKQREQLEKIKDFYKTIQNL